MYLYYLPHKGCYCCSLVIKPELHFIRHSLVTLKLVAWNLIQNITFIIWFGMTFRFMTVYSMITVHTSGSLVYWLTLDDISSHCIGLFNPVLMLQPQLWKHLWILRLSMKISKHPHCTCDIFYYIFLICTWRNLITDFRFLCLYITAIK